MSPFTQFYPQDITFSVRAMFRVSEMTALCIRSRISPPLAPNSSLIASSTSVDQPPKSSMMMLYCPMSYPGNCRLSSQRRGPYLMVFSSCFFSLLSVYGQLISTARHSLAARSTPAGSAGLPPISLRGALLTISFP